MNSARDFCASRMEKIRWMRRAYIRNPMRRQRKLLEKLGFSTEDVKNRKLSGIGKKISDYPKLAEELGVGELTLKDIVKELEKPARDPREDMPKPILRSDVLEIKDLKPGMILKGTVRNVIDFGAFVDIGVHQDGLVHISQICDRYIKHPLEGSERRGHRGCAGHERGCEEAENSAYHEISKIEKQVGEYETVVCRGRGGNVRRRLWTF